MELSTCILVPCHPKNATAQPNAPAKSASDLLVTSFLSCTLATVCMVGLVGNVYMLVVITIFTRCTGSVYIISLALADLLYLPTVPFMVCTYFMWDFGDLSCRILFSLDLLTMHTSIFILTIMSTKYYLAIIRPLDTLRRSRDHQWAVICLVAFLFTLPTRILINLYTSHCNRVTKRMCCPKWQMGTYKVYLTIIFNTCILVPGVICCLYTKLARTYWRSQRGLVLSTEETSQCPRQKVLCMIFIIVLTYWACFLPFWLGQLFSISWYEQGDRGGTTIVSIIFLFGRCRGRALKSTAAAVELQMLIFHPPGQVCLTRVHTLVWVQVKPFCRRTRCCCRLHEAGKRY